MHRPGVELANFRSRVRRPNHYTTEEPPSILGMNVISPETRIMGLPYGEEIVIVGQTMWTQSTSASERQTDGWTERQYYDNQTASRGKNETRNTTHTQKGKKRRRKKQEEKLMKTRCYNQNEATQTAPGIIIMPGNSLLCGLYDGLN